MPSQTTSSAAKTSQESSDPLAAEQLQANVSGPLGSNPIKRFYVDCNSGHDNASGESTTEAWASLAKVTAHRFAPGDAVYFKSGCTFNGGVFINGSGTAEARILVSSYGTGAAPVLRNADGPSWGSCVEVTGSYIVVEKLDLRDTTAAGVRLAPRTNHDIVRNNTVSNAGFGVYVNGSAHLITHNRITNLHMAVNTPGGQDDHGAIGFPVNGTDNEISYNSCNGCRAPSNDWGTDGGFVEIWNDGDRTYIHHNLAVNCQGFIEFGAQSADFAARNVVIAYNVINNVNVLATINRGNSYSIFVDGLRFLNNTVIQTQKADTLIVFPNVSSSSMVIQNNIFVLGGGVSLWWNAAPFVHTNNLFDVQSGSRIGWTLGPAEKVGDPSFVNMAAGDYRLNSTSPAINLGVVASGQSVDFAGKSITGAPDAGAFEQ